MTILYFYQYFSTPNGSWGTRVYEFAKRWTKKGDKIIVVTSIYDKSDLTATGTSTKMDFDGVEVRVLNIKISNRHSFLYRIYTFFLYSILSSYYALTIPCDLVIASSGPITVGIPGLVARYLRGRKLIFEARDLWPEGAIQMGMLKNKLVRKLAYGFEKICYKAASSIVALSPGMRDEIQAKHFNSNVYSIPNACDNDIFGKDTHEFQLPDWAKNKKIFLYTGNIGKVNNSWLIVKAAQNLDGIELDVLFLLIGDGQEKIKIKDYIKENNIKNIKILDLMPKSTLVGFVQRAYFMLVPLEGKPILDTSSPNKLFDAMAAGVPVIQTTQGWIKDLIHNENFGITVPFDQPEYLAKKISEIIRKPELRNLMALNAKNIAETQFDRDILAEQMHDILNETIARS